MRFLIVGAALALCLMGCGEKTVKPNPPAPAVIGVPTKVYVPIDKKFRARCPWVKDAPPAQVFDVSNGRKRCLVQYEAQFDKIDQVQGTPVPEEKP